MNNFFKMSLVAAAIAVSGTASAGVLTPTAAGLFSAEGIAITPAAVQLGGGFTYVAGTDYEAGAVITFTYSDNAIASNAKFPASILTTAGAGGTGTMTLTKSAQTANTVSYTVTAKQGLDTVIGNIITVPSSTSLTTVDGVLLNTAAIKAGPVTVKASAVYQGVAFDPDTTTSLPADAKKNRVASTTTQFGEFAVTTALAGSIKLADGALDKELVAATDTLELTYTAPASVPVLAVIGADDAVNKLASVKLTTKLSVKGNFAGFEADQFTTGATLTATGFDFAAAPAATVTTPVAVVITPDEDVNDALVVQDFSVVPMVSYTGGSKSFPVLNAGKWTVDAAVANVPYMPYGTGISQVIYVTNTESTAAEVSAVATDNNGNKYALGVLGTAAANSTVTKLSTPIKDALAAQGFTEGKVSLDFFFSGVAAAADGVKVYSAYNVNASDRGFVANTTNGSK